MSVLVTGGAGYIGSHAVRLLVEEGLDVVVLDNLSKGHRESIAPGAVFHEGDIADQNLLARLLTLHDVTSVMHFAAFIEVGESVREPGLYYRNNFSNAVAMLETVRTHGVRDIIFSSTAAVYGDPLQTPIDENHPRQPINPYGRSKMMTEMALEDYRAAFGLGYTILRYFNVAGAAPDASIGEAHEPESHLIPRILKSAAPSAPSVATVDIFGTDYPTDDGTCVRDYIHVMDLARAHLLALKTSRAGQGRIYNLGSENGFSVCQVIETCERVTGLKINAHTRERRPGDPAVLIASSAKIREELGWERRYPDLETIVTHAWNWHRSHPDGFRSPTPRAPFQQP